VGTTARSPCSHSSVDHNVSTDLTLLRGV
jgi:hypothetical protein